MFKWIKVAVKYLVAGPELDELERYRLACGQVERWNSQLPQSARTAEWIRSQASGNTPTPCIARFREQLRALEQPVVAPVPQTERAGLCIEME